MITTEQIKELRDATGVSVMQCKKALEETSGDMAKALLVLKKKSADIAAKKSERDDKDGLLVVKMKDGKAILTVLSCETDFVSKNDDFVALTNKIADIALEKGIEVAKKESEPMINELIQKIGENIRLKQVASLEGKILGSYVHNGKVGVVVALSSGSEAVAKDVAMHIAAMKPEFAKKEDIAQDAINAVKEIFMKEVEATGKPQEMKDKIMQGKIDAYFKERTLSEQSFIKNPDQTIGAMLAANKAVLSNFLYSKLG